MLNNIPAEVVTFICETLTHLSFKGNFKRTVTLCYIEYLPIAYTVNTKNGDIITTDGLQIIVFDHFGIFKVKFSRDNDFALFSKGIAVDSDNGDIVVTDEYSIWKYTFTGELKFISHPIPDTTNLIPNRLALDKIGNIYLTFRCSSNAEVPTKIQVFDKNGKFVKYFGNDNSCPNGIAIDKAGHIVVTDLLRYQVLVYSQDGALLFSFGAKKFRRPGEVACDPFGNFYIHDAFLGDLVSFSPLGEFQKTILGSLPTGGFYFNHNSELVVKSSKSNEYHFFS